MLWSSQAQHNTQYLFVGQPELKKAGEMKHRRGTAWHSIGQLALPRSLQVSKVQ